MIQSALNSCLGQGKLPSKKALADSLGMTPMGLDKLMQMDALPSFPTVRRIFRLLVRLGLWDQAACVAGIDLDREIDRRALARVQEVLGDAAERLHAKARAA